jgi:flavin reductase (DIM6/NTAB) family NADH-FMN oxidoreductase RutF
MDPTIPMLHAETHVTIEPAILYFGTPVVLLSTLNEDGSPNLAPMSSVWWLGWRAMLGLGTSGKTLANLRRTRECVLNLPSVDQVAAVNRLALLTGSNPVPPAKHDRGYRYEKDKFGVTGLTPLPSQTVAAPCVEECPVQMEATVMAIHGLAEEDDRWRGKLAGIEVRITRVHVHPSILMEGHAELELTKRVLTSTASSGQQTPQTESQASADRPAPDRMQQERAQREVRSTRIRSC